MCVARDQIQFVGVSDSASAEFKVFEGNSGDRMRRVVAGDDTDGVSRVAHALGGLEVA